MNQTTITLSAVEEVVGLTLQPIIRGQANDFHRQAWELLTRKSDLVDKSLDYPETNFNPENQDEFTKYVAWEKATLERIDRVVRKRTFQTKVEVLRARPDGTPFQWKITIFWNRPSPPSLLDTPGIWTLLRISKGGQRRVITKINAVLECFGDELYEHLPDIGEYEVYPDLGEIVVSPKQGEETYLFRFRATR